MNRRRSFASSTSSCGTTCVTSPCRNSEAFRSWAEDYVPRPRETHELDQAHASTMARDKADHVLPEHEAGVLRRRCVRTRERASTQLQGPHGRDTGFEPFDGRLGGSTVAVVQTRPDPNRARSGEVATCGERLASSGQDYLAPFLSRCVREYLQQLGLQRLVEGVPLVGTVQLHEERAVFQRGSQSSVIV